MAYKFQLGAARLSGSIEQTDGASIKAQTELQIGSAAVDETELGILEGATVTTAELNYLDGADANINTLALPASTTISSFGASIVDDADAAAVRTTIGTVIGTNVQAQDAGLQYLADLAITNEATFQEQTGLEIGVDVQAQDAGLQYLADLTITDEATFQEQTGLEIGVDVQAYDAELDTLSGMSSAAATAAAALSDAEYAFLDGATVGTVVGSKAVIASAAKDISGVRDLFGRTLSASADLYAGIGIYAAQIGIADVSGIIAANSGLTQTSGELHLDPNVAGSGLTLTSGVLDVDLSEASAGTINVANDSFLFTDADDSDNTKQDTIADFMTAVAGDALAATSGVLAVQVDDSSIETNADSLRVKDAGITNAMLSGSITADKLATGAGLTDNAGALEAAVDDSSIEKAGGTLNVKALGVTNGMLAGSIANAKLSNSSVSFGGVSLSLGGVDATPAFDLSDATAYPGDSSLVTAGALNAGSITSGFGAIDNGSSAITTTGTGSFGKVVISGDLEVSGDLTYIDTANLRVSDAKVVFADGAAALADGQGFYIGSDAGDSSEKASFAVDLDIDGAGLDGFNSSLPIKASAFYGELVGSAREDVSVFTASVELKVGINKAGSYTGNLNMLLPTSMTAGTVIRVKASDQTNSTDRKIQITRQGSDTIDGSNTSITLESPFASVSLIKTAGSEWMVF